MPPLELVPFGEEHLAAAGKLLAERHRRHRKAEPLLPARFETPADARAAVEAEWRKEGASGAAALRDGRLGGYVLGAPDPNPVWGPNVWVGYAGHAAAEAEAVRDLYADAAGRWAESGLTRHYSLVPATDVALVDAWFRLGFGQQQAHGIREVAAEPWPASVREAGTADVDAMVALAPLLNEHQALAPVFSGVRPSWTVEELRRDIEEDLKSGMVGNLVAEADGRIVGNFVVAPVESTKMHASLGRPDGACYLAFAITAPEARGSGAGLALTAASFAWAARAGYSTMVTDWRVTNLVSSRFWPRRRFRSTFLRLYRSIP
jgi:ribosomal protein S18 acetylase RimI-like enzyme